MFMPQNDRLIIMSDYINPLLPEEFIMLADAGAKTVFMQGGFLWREMQPTPESPINWTMVDDFIGNARRAGLRALIPFVCSLPDWFPPDWYYSREISGSAHNIASYINPDVATAIDNLLAEAIARYSVGVQFIFGMPSDGEFPTCFWPDRHDIDFSHEVLRDWVIARQRLFVLQSNEIWTAYHPYTRPAWWNCVYDGLKAAYPNSIHRQIVYTYWPHQQTNPDVEWYVQAQRGRGIGVFVGSEWVTGLRANMRWMQEAGLYGFLTCPNHYTQINKRITPWQLKEIEWAVVELEKYAAV